MAVDGHTDWDHLLRIVKRQRVAGLVRDGLAQAGVTPPPHFANQIESIAFDIVRQNLQFAAESLSIQKLFDEAGVPVLFVKGVTLAQLAYGNLALKHSWDIDLLVAPNAVPKALQLLAQLGYRAFPALPPATSGQYKRWLRFAREYLLFHDTNSVHVEIHWRLTDNDYFLTGISAQSPTQLVNISNGATLRTLTDDDLFFYLCVHGASHGWSRLKWLADVAALMSDDDSADAERRLAAARKVHAEDCVAQTFLLCDRLFGIPSLSALSLRLRRTHRYRWLESVALAAMTKGHAETELGSAPFDRLPIILSQFLLGRGLRFGANELWNKMNGPYDLNYANFPSWLEYLYPLVRFASWIARRGQMRAILRPPKPAPE